MYRKLLCLHTQRCYSTSVDHCSSYNWSLYHDLLLFQALWDEEFEIRQRIIYKTEKESAIEKFEVVIMMEESHGSSEFSFASLRYVVVLTMELH